MVTRTYKIKKISRIAPPPKKNIYIFIYTPLLFISTFPLYHFVRSFYCKKSGCNDTKTIQEKLSRKLLFNLFNNMWWQNRLFGEKQPIKSRTFCLYIYIYIYIYVYIEHYLYRIYRVRCGCIYIFC